MYDCQDILPFLHIPITSPLAARISNRSVDSSLSTSIKVAMPKIARKYNWGERELAPPLMMSTALASVRPRTSRRLRMRDIHVIYADSNSADCWARTRSRSPPNVLHFTSKPMTGNKRYT